MGAHETWDPDSIMHTRLAALAAASMLVALATVVPTGATAIAADGADASNGARFTAPASTGAAANRRGERLFLQCRACHSLGTETAGKVGPPLLGLLGRKAGTYPDFGYSSALAASGLTWDDATLDRWLASPATVVPGTSMVFAGLPKSEDRRALIDYLRIATR